MSVDKGEKICRFYPAINKKNIILFGVLFCLCPIPIIFLVYYFGFIKSIESAISYIIVMDLIFIISAPFIMFIIYYLQSVAVYSNGILSFSPSNNKETFMSWESMVLIENDFKYGNNYYVVKSSIENDILWFPYFYKKNKEFIREISKYAGKSHILYENLCNQ